MEVLETCMFGTDQKIGLVGGVGENSVIDPEMFYSTGPLKLGSFRNMEVLETCMFGTDQKVGLVGGVGENSVIDPMLFYRSSETWKF